MVGIILDLIVLIFAKMALEQDDSPDWRGLLLAVVIITVVNVVLMLTLGQLIGLFVLIPMGLVAVFLLMLMCQMTLRNATIAAAAMVIARMILAYVL
jgi:hypothetical protein